MIIKVALKYSFSLVFWIPVLSLLWITRNCKT